ncbi:MAG TPA: head GIN domain-containing protein [Pseudomonadales bacterium]
MNIIRRALPIVLLGVVPQLAIADTEFRLVSGFTEVGVTSGIDVDIRQGAEFEVEVEAEDTDDVITEVVGDTLRIYKDNSWHWYSFGLLSFFVDDDPMKVTVTLPELTRIRTSGGSDVRGQGSFSGEDLELRSSGGSNITLDLQYDSIDARSSGGSTMHLSGSANRGMLTSSGGSRQDNDELAVMDAELRSSGGSTLNVGVVGELQARASGGSNIRYEGDPMVRDIDESGGAKVMRR